MRCIWGNDDGPSARSEGIGWGALLILMLVFWLGVRAWEIEARHEAEAVREIVAQTDR